MMTIPTERPTTGEGRTDPNEGSDAIIPLGAAETATCGAKAGNLGGLLRAGFRVPDGFVIAAGAFESSIRSAGLGDTATEEAVLATPLPSALDGAIRHAYRALGSGPVAVRSSGLAEDLEGAAFAGQYETVLDVRGEEDVLLAVRRCWASAFAPRVLAYVRSVGAARGAMAVLVQRMAPAVAAGVAFSADPVTGARDVVVLSAVRGLGERLVSGESSADEWTIRGDDAVRRRQGEDAIDLGQAREVAALVRRVADRRGAPIDIEWAFADGALHLLQARPMTALPEPITWKSPHPGAWIRNFRLGEWIGDPVTPLFESWLIERLEHGLMSTLAKIAPGGAIPAVHVTVNGWYFYGLDYFPKTLMENLRSLAVAVPSMLRDFRYVAGFIPPIAHLGFDRHVELWRGEVQPAYRALVAEAEREIDHVEVDALAAWIDRLAAQAAQVLVSIVALGGSAAKMEAKLLALWHAHVAPDAAAGPLALVRALDATPETPRHAVEGLDWFFPTVGERADRGEVVHVDVPASARARMVSERDALEARAHAALTPKLRARFDAVLALTRRAHAMREEQSRELTLAWPVMRRAISRIGEALVLRGALTDPEDIHFLLRTEVEPLLRGEKAIDLSRQASERRRTWERQRKLSPPLLLGELSPPWTDVFAGIEKVIGATFPPGALKGMPGSPGRVTGKARVVRSLSELGRLRAGEILVAPLTTPAWTPAFAIAAAIVTDTGSIASHASIVAREYGIPAVVGVEGATTTLVDGQTITVDGAGGFVAL